MEISWETLEYKHTPKSADWFWFVWIVAIAVIIVSIMRESYLFAVLIFVSAFVVSLQAVKEAKLIRCIVNEKGIIIYDKLHKYEELQSYWISENQHFPQIYIRIKNKFSPYLTLPLGNTNQEEVDKFLSSRIQKTDPENSFRELLNDLF